MLGVAAVAEGEAAIIPGNGVLRIGLDRLLEVGERPVGVALGGENDAAVIVALGEVGARPERLRQVGDGAVVIAARGVGVGAVGQACASPPSSLMAPS